GDEVSLVIAGFTFPPKQPLKSDTQFSSGHATTGFSVGFVPDTREEITGERCLGAEPELRAAKCVQRTTSPGSGGRRQGRSARARGDAHSHAKSPLPAPVGESAGLYDQAPRAGWGGDVAGDLHPGSQCLPVLRRSDA